MCSDVLWASKLYEKNHSHGQDRPDVILILLNQFEKSNNAIISESKIMYYIDVCETLCLCERVRNGGQIMIIGLILELFAEFINPNTVG